MSLPRGARLETLLLTAALAALTACGTAGNTSSPVTCSMCQGALCGSTCTDLSSALATKVQLGLPASTCVSETPIQGGATVCSAQTCGAAGAAGCAVMLSWTPVTLGKDTHLLEGAVTATSLVDAHLPGYDCSATVTANVLYTATATFVCAPGSESATFGAITPKLDRSSVAPAAGCELLVTYLDLFRPTFEEAALSAATTALAQATASVTATCP